MGAYDTIAVDKDLETKGVILDYGSYRVTIARAGGNNKRFQKVLESVSRPYMRAIQTDTMDNDRAEDLLKEAYAKSIVINWEVKDGETAAGKQKYKQGMFDLDGETVLKFTPENVVKLFKAPELFDLWMDVRNNSQRASLFRASVLEAQAGN